MEEKNKIKTQKQNILEYLKSGESIDRETSLALFGCLRLNARITDLRKEGYNIRTELVHIGGPIRRAKYTLEDGTDNK